MSFGIDFSDARVVTPPLAEANGVTAQHLRIAEVIFGHLAVSVVGPQVPAQGEEDLMPQGWQLAIDLVATNDGYWDYVFRNILRRRNGLPLLP